MKAAQFKKYGGLEEIEILDTPTPQPLKGQVLVEVYASGLNRIDSYFRQGGLKVYQPVELPATLGGDFAGIVKKLGEGVTSYKVGDRVYGMAGIYRNGSGSIADFAVADLEKIAPKPTELDFVSSASLPLTATSALQAIEEELKVKPGQKILIQGGAGGIGHIAIQIAKMLGAFVATTVGTKDIGYVKGLGTDQVIDHQKEDVSQILKDFDGVLNTANPKDADKLFKILKKGGKFVSMTGQPDQNLAKQYDVVSIGQATKTNSEQLTIISKLVDSGKIIPFVEKVFPFEETKQAFEYYETKHPRGKVVVEIS